MAITFVKTGTIFVYAKESNPSLNIVIARISDFEKSVKKTDIIIDMSGKDLLIRMANENERNTAFALIEAQFAQ